MSSSWGHAIGRLGEELLQEYAQRRKRDLERWGRTYSGICSRPKCGEVACHVTRYLYVTGRAGRVTDSERLACPKHAAAFAKKYELDLDAAPVVNRGIGGGFARFLREAAS